MIERLDPRLILDAPLALASDGLVLADPEPDELLEPALFVDAAPSAQATATAAPAPPDDLSPQQKATAASRSLNLLLNTTSCGGTATISLISLGNVGEAPVLGPPTNYFRFEAHGCGLPPPTSMTVGFSLGGTATIDVDYSSSELAAGYVQIPMTSDGYGNSYGSKDVAFSAIDDELDELDETIRVTVNSASTDTGATLLTPLPLSPVDAVVASGDYKVNKVFQEKEGGGHEDAVFDPPPPKWFTTIGNDDSGFPKKERSIGVQIYEAGKPIANLEVTLTRHGSTGTANVKVLDGQRNEANNATSKTNGEGVAYFTIRYTAGAEGDTQQFEASWVDEEGNEADIPINVKIV